MKHALRLTESMFLLPGKWSLTCWVPRSLMIGR